MLSYSCCAMAWKSVICVVLLAEIHNGQSISHEQSAAVSVNPNHYHYFINSVLPVCPQLQPNVYRTSRRKRSPTHEVGCSHGEEKSAQKSRQIGYLHNDDDADVDYMRYLIDKAHRSRGGRSTPQEGSGSNIDNDVGGHIRSFLKKRLEKLTTLAHHEKTRASDKSHPKRHDHDTHDVHRDRFKAHSRSPGTRGHEHDHCHIKHDHSVHRDKAKARLSPRNPLHHLSEPMLKTPYDKMRVFTDVGK